GNSSNADRNFDCPSSKSLSVLFNKLSTLGVKSFISSTRSLALFNCSFTSDKVPEIVGSMLLLYSSANSSTLSLDALPISRTSWKVSSALSPTSSSSSILSSIVSNASIRSWTCSWASSTSSVLNSGTSTSCSSSSSL